MLSGKKRILIAVLLLISLFALSSCSKKSEDTSGKNNNANVDEAAISDSNFTESDEDLLTVDYKKFYDELAPHGDWVKVSAKDLGIDLKKGESSGESSSLLNDLIGIKDAYADDVGFGFFFVWRPSPELAISVSAGEPPVYVPYCRGRWIYTDDGWYFRAPTPYEEITCHYGRWAYDPLLGWVWIPGRVWAPAWVQWYDDDDYIAWTPLPPSVYIVDGVCPPVFIDDDRYVICGTRYFTDPDIYRHCLFYNDFHDRIHIRDMHRVNGVMVENHRVFDNGPDYKRIGTIAGRNIEPVKINKVSNMDKVKYSRNEMNVYSPHFSRVKGNVKNENVIKPNKFASYDNAKNRVQNERKNHAGPVNDNKGKQSVHKGVKMKRNGSNNEHLMGGNKDNGFNKKNNQRNNKEFEKFRKTSRNGNNSGSNNYNQKRQSKGNRYYNKQKNSRNYNSGTQIQSKNRQGHQKQYRNNDRGSYNHNGRQNNKSGRNYNSGSNNNGSDGKKQQYDRGSNNHGRGKR